MKMVYNRKKYMKEYYRKNKEKILNRSNKYRKENTVKNIVILMGLGIMQIQELNAVKEGIMKENVLILEKH